MQMQYADQLWLAYKMQVSELKMSMLKSQILTIKGKTMRFQYFLHGPKPSNGYTLIFGFHGGGNCPSSVNDGQYKNHLHLYDGYLPKGCIWFVPRSCEQASDMWHKQYMEDFLAQIIEAFVVNEIVDVNKVFISGYSAGGDGIYHMAPRMADVLAGAAMMAGHPNKVHLFNIRNIAFSIQVGGTDGAYNRNKQATKYIRCLNQLQRNYGGFNHMSLVHPGMPHWLQKQDAKIFNWLLSQKRDPYPDLILFKQHPRRRRTLFYYIRIQEIGSQNEELVVHKTGNTFQIISNNIITILINRKMADFSKNIKIYHNGELTVEQKPESNKQIMQKTLMQRKDYNYIFEDQFTSVPPKKVDTTAAIQNKFKLTNQHKVRQYEQPLPLHPNPRKLRSQQKNKPSTHNNSKKVHDDDNCRLF